MKKIILGLSIALISGSFNIANAHQSGCHRWHSCPSDSGSYVCGDLGYTNFCPNTSPSTNEPVAPAPAPAPAPIPTPAPQPILEPKPIVPALQKIQSEQTKKTESAPPTEIVTKETKKNIEISWENEESQKGIWYEYVLSEIEINPEYFSKKDWKKLKNLTLKLKRSKERKSRTFYFYLRSVDKDGNKSESAKMEIRF